MTWSYPGSGTVVSLTGTDSLSSCSGDGVPTSGTSYIVELDTIHHLWMIFNLEIDMAAGAGHKWEEKDQLIYHVKNSDILQGVDANEDADNDVQFGLATLTNPFKPIVYAGCMYLYDQNTASGCEGYGWSGSSNSFEGGQTHIYGGVFNTWPVQTGSGGGTLFYWWGSVIGGDEGGDVFLIGVNLCISGGNRFNSTTGRLQELKFGGSRRKGTSMPASSDVISVKDVIFMDNLNHLSMSSYMEQDFGTLNAAFRGWFDAARGEIYFDNTWDADAVVQNSDAITEWAGTLGGSATCIVQTSYDIRVIDENGNPIDKLNVRVIRTLSDDSEPPVYTADFLQVDIGDTNMVDATTISASTTDDSFNDSGSGFDESISADDEIIVSGFTESANNGVFTVISATTAKIIVAENLVTEVAGDQVSISAGKRPKVWLIRQEWDSSTVRTHFSGFFATIRKYGYDYEHIAKYPVYGAGEALVDVIIMKTNQFTDEAEATVAAYTGIAMSSPNITVTVDHTLQEVYDWLQWECAKQANMDFESGGNGVEVSPLGTADGNVFVVATGWNLVVTGATLDVDGKILEHANGDRRVEINLTDMEPGSYYTIHKDGDPPTTYLYEGYVGDDGEFSTPYDWLQTNIDVEVRVRLQGYYENIQSAQITSGGLTIAINSAIDPNYRAPEGAFTQTHFRWRNDNGDEDGATWKAAEDVNITGQALGVNVRLRTQMEENTGERPARLKPKIQYREVGGYLWEDVGDKP